ncbi:transmembrane protein, putative [Medicago truncatula]|uniref:Transmembrane protein, putative n=1 Tax=Medicago truncatula TaxID=3880 RepID=G7I9M8_MEDTR|nr:transmembrane protein, putative [Medicago truncatula]
MIFGFGAISAVCAVLGVGGKITLCTIFGIAFYLVVYFHEVLKWLQILKHCSAELFILQMPMMQGIISASPIGGKREGEKANERARNKKKPAEKPHR